MLWRRRKPVGGRRFVWIRRSHHVAIHVAARRNRIQQHFVHFLNERLYVSLENSVKLECLSCRKAEGRQSQFLGKLVQHEPLLRSRSPARQPDAKHKAESLLLAGFLERGALIPIVL